jgi:hypothetical protein
MAGNFGQNRPTPSMSPKAAEFMRRWRAAFGKTPRDWDDRQALADGSSSWADWSEFVDDGRTNMAAIGEVMETFQEPPTFREFRRAYFSRVSPGNSTVCTLCAGVRYLWAVQGDELIDGRMVRRLIGPGRFKARALPSARVTTVYCRCNPNLGKGGGHDGQKIGATSNLEAAEFLADECRVLGGDVPIYGRLKPGAVVPLAGVEDADRLAEEAMAETQRETF